MYLFEEIILRPIHCLVIFERKYLEEYMVLNMKTWNGNVGRIEN